MKRPHYDKRMHLIDNLRWGLWRPLFCKLLGHRITCYGLTPGRGIISGYVYICGKCMKMEDHQGPCGQCDNGCRRDDDDDDDCSDWVTM